MAGAPTTQRPIALIGDTPNYLLDALSGWGNDLGKHWSNRNAEFEAGNPSFPRRVAEAVNPMAGFGLGPALGGMHDAARAGSKGGMAIAGLQAMPLLAALRMFTVPAAGMAKASQVLLPSAKATLKNAVVGATASAGVDEVQARQPK